MTWYLYSSQVQSQQLPWNRSPGLSGFSVWTQASPPLESLPWLPKADFVKCSHFCPHNILFRTIMANPHSIIYSYLILKPWGKHWGLFSFDFLRLSKVPGFNKCLLKKNKWVNEQFSITHDIASFHRIEGLWWKSWMFICFLKWPIKMLQRVPEPLPTPTPQVWENRAAPVFWWSLSNERSSIEQCNTLLWSKALWHIFKDFAMHYVLSIISRLQQRGLHATRAQGHRRVYGACNWTA